MRYDSPGAGGGERRVGSVATPAARAAMGGMTESPPAAGLIAASDQTAGVAPGVTVAPVRFGDLRGVARLQRRAFRPRLAYTLTTLVVLWLLPQVRFVVAREAGRLVGCAIGDRQDHHSRVVNIAVEPEARRRGVATTLLRALEAALPEGNVLLMVEADNLAARALYEREGYARVGDARDYYGRGRDGVWMQKRRTTLATPKFWV